MAGSLTDEFEVDVLKALLGQATTIITTTPLSAVYLAATTTVPTDSTPGTEVTGGSYARVDVKSLMGTPAAGAATNSSDIEFAIATAAWGDIVGVELYDAATLGNRLGWADVTTKTIDAGDQLVFRAGELDITLT